MDTDGHGCRKDGFIRKTGKQEKQKERKFRKLAQIIDGQKHGW
jgi:hypothetical protein